MSALIPGISFPSRYSKKAPPAVEIKLKSLIAFILLSMNLIIQRNKELLINLYSIGYNYGKIAKFYQVLIGSITIFAITISMVVSNKIRNLYSAEIINFFEFSESKNYITIIGVSFILTLVILFTILILNSIKKIVIPKKI